MAKRRRKSSRSCKFGIAKNGRRKGQCLKSKRAKKHRR